MHAICDAILGAIGKSDIATFSEHRSALERCAEQKFSGGGGQTGGPAQNAAVLVLVY
jgi:hypothetical protein